jgi:hypothetical protein
MRSICTIEGCGLVVAGRGYCTKHWTRWRRYGDPMRVKDRSEYISSGETHTNYVHGLESHPLYHTWRNMMQRCYRQGTVDFERYGARGITVDERWHSVKNFVSDMSPKPAGMTLERRDNNAPYSRDNCYWDDRKQQARNRRTTKLDPKKVEQIRAIRLAGNKLQDIADAYDVHRSTIKKVLSGKTWS